MQIVANGYPTAWAYQFNFVDGAFKDIRIRTANLAINRAEMKALLGEYMIESYGTILPSMPYYGEPSFKVTYDPKQATALLKGGLSVQIAFAISTSGSGQI